jgi:dTMP kinase
MFIVFEGLDGAGKSSLMGRLEAHLQATGRPVCRTREPGGTPLAESLRQLLLAVDQDPPVGRVELLLYAASRAQHVERLIRPRLTQGDWVLCDRFTASTVAFQHYARGVDRSSVDWLNAFATQQLRPHQTILLDLPWETAEARTRGRGAKDRMEQESAEFHKKVRQGYLQEAAADPKGWLVLDAEKSPEQLEQDVLLDWRNKGWVR